MISDVAAAISMTKLPSDLVDEEDEELQVIVEHEGMVSQNKLIKIHSQIIIYKW